MGGYCIGREHVTLLCLTSHSSPVYNSYDGSGGIGSNTQALKLESSKNSLRRSHVSCIRSDLSAPPGALLGVSFGKVHDCLTTLSAAGAVGLLEVVKRQHIWKPRLRGTTCVVGNGNDSHSHWCWVLGGSSRLLPRQSGEVSACKIKQTP